jgi:hypothetical protein
MLRRVALVRTDISEEPSTSIIRVTRMGELGTTLAPTSNRRRLYSNFSSPLLWRRLVHPKLRLLQEPHGVIPQKTQFFIVTAVKTSNLTRYPYQWFYSLLLCIITVHFQRQLLLLARTELFWDCVSQTAYCRIGEGVVILDTKVIRGNSYFLNYNLSWHLPGRTEKF